MNRIALVLLTGFLGSGKTTLLKRLLTEAEFRDTAIVINEAGDVGLDHLLVEQPAESIVMLDGGCLCCRTKGSLIPALAGLLRKQRSEGLPPFRRVVVETSGLSDPAVLLEELSADVFFNRNFALAGVVTVIDIRAFAPTISSHPEARNQVLLADRLLLTKTDLADTADALDVRCALAAINPHCPQAAVPSTGYIGGMFWPEALELPRSALDTAWRSVTAATPVATAALAFPGVLSEDMLEEWLNHTLELFGPQLLRMKAMLDVEHSPLPTALHIVRGLLHRPVAMSAWPDGARTNRIVLIAEDVEQQILIDALARLAACAETEVLALAGG